MARSVVEPAMFYVRQEMERMGVHVDDILLLGGEPRVDELIGVFQAHLMIKVIARLTDVGQEVGYVGRILRRTARGFELEAHPRIVESFVKMCGVSDARRVATPAVRYSYKQLALAAELAPSELTSFRSALGLVQYLASYLAHDRVDLQQAAHLIATGGCAPTSTDEWRLKRVA